MNDGASHEKRGLPAQWSRGWADPAVRRRPQLHDHYAANSADLPSADLIFLDIEPARSAQVDYGTGR